MKTKFPKLRYDEKNKMIEAEFKKNTHNKNKILSSIKAINKKLDSHRKVENDLFYDLDIYHSLLYLTIRNEAAKAGFKEKKKVIFIRDNSEHIINGMYLDKESLELCLNITPLPKINSFNKDEFPIKLKHLKISK